MTFNLQTPDGITTFYALSLVPALRLAQVAADEFNARCALLDGDMLTIRRFDPA